MKKLILIFILSSIIYAKDSNKIYLKNGDIYICYIIDNNEELEKYVIEIKGGSRINISYNDVEKIENISIPKNGSIGMDIIGIGTSNGLFNLNYFFNNNFSLLAGYSLEAAVIKDEVETNSSFVIGARYYFKSLSNGNRPFTSITYGAVGATSRTNGSTNQEEFTFHKGIRLGGGIQRMFGLTKKHGLIIEICYHLTSGAYETYLDSQNWTGDAPKRAGFVLGYEYGF